MAAPSIAHRASLSSGTRAARIAALMIMVACAGLCPGWAALPTPAAVPTDTAGEHRHTQHAKQPRVLLDNFYNNEWRTDSAGVRARYHYLWQDTTNSDSLSCEDHPWARSIRRHALPETRRRMSPECGCVHHRRSGHSEGNRSPYDHRFDGCQCPCRMGAPWRSARAPGQRPRQCRPPGTLDARARFGIRFNEDSRTGGGEGFQTGTFEKLPPHPLFNGVRKVYLKEVSTLSSSRRHSPCSSTART